MKEKMKASKTGMLRANGLKLPASLAPLEAHLIGSAIYGFGAAKYDRHNWRKGTKWSEVCDCLLRHMTFWMLGEDDDPDARVNHLTNAYFNVASLIVMWATGTGEDDRYKMPPDQLAKLRKTIEETGRLMNLGIDEYKNGKRHKLHKQLLTPHPIVRKRKKR